MLMVDAAMPRRNKNERNRDNDEDNRSYAKGRNDAIHTLTRDKNQILRVDLQSFSGEQAYAMYSAFYIGDEANKYILTVSGYNGTAVDSLGYHSCMKFTTKDWDNDMYSGSCAINNHGGWWFRACHPANLNGQYAQSAVSAWHYIVWQHCKGTE
ncbi:ficolin-1-like [Saccostrea cucullata]|uniref:ficolin-1-like n=1 Tax=Saccostrea cuccullata TaxID=36930 RepID=UPI002ED690D9